MHKFLLGVFLFVTSLAIRKLTGSDKGIADDASFDLSNILLIFIWLSGFCWAVFVLRKKTSVIFDSLSLFVIGLCFWFFLISPIAYVPWKSALATFSILSLFLTFLAFLVVYSEKDFYLSVFWTYLIFVLFSIVIYFILPEIGSLYTWEGVSSNRLSGLARHPNIMGPLSAFMSCLAFWSYKQKWISPKLFITAFAIGTLGVILTQSRTSILALLCAYWVFWLFSDPKRRSLTPLAALALLILGSIFFVDPDFFLSLAERSDGTDLLSGRGYVWDFSFDLIKDSPVFGYGYNSTFYIFQDYSELLSSFVGGYIFPHSHNMFLQVLLSGGIVALVIVLLILFFVIRKALVFNDYKLLSAISFYCCYTYSEDGGFFQYVEILMVVLMFCVTNAIYISDKFRIAGVRS